MVWVVNITLLATPSVSLIKSIIDLNDRGCGFKPLVTFFYLWLLSRNGKSKLQPGYYT